MSETFFNLFGAQGLRTIILPSCQQTYIIDEVKDYVKRNSFRYTLFIGIIYKNRSLDFGENLRTAQAAGQKTGSYK